MTDNPITVPTSAAAFKTMRRQLHLSQAGLGHLLDYDRGHIGRIERGTQGWRAHYGYSIAGVAWQMTEAG